MSLSLHTSNFIYVLNIRVLIDCTYYLDNFDLMSALSSTPT